MDELKLEKHGRVTVLTMNRPERRNALNAPLASALEAAVADFKSDSEQRVLIITGAGDEAFCSGADLLEARGRLARGERLPMATEQDIVGIASCEKPVIGAINGLAVGGGLEIALCCDMRVATESAWFALPEVERGFIAGLAAVTLPRFMPMGAVMELMMVGDRLSAADAYRLGLVQQVVPKGDLMAEAMRRAERMSGHSPSALWGTKQVLKFWRDRMMEEQQRYYEAVVHRVFLSGDLVEGLAAFEEKRRPEFSDGWPDPFRPR